MVSEASWKARTVRSGDYVTDIDRGQFCHSVRFMARAWSWTPAKVYRFLGRLADHEMIEKRNSTETAPYVITICNYDEYQGERNSADAKPEQHRNSTETEKKKVIREEEKEKVRTPLPPKRGEDKSDADALEILSGVMPRDVAEAYAAHRRAKRAKLTKRAAELIAKALFGHPNPASVVEASIANGWTGVFPERWRPPRDGPEERPRFDVAAVLRELKEAERKAS